MMSINSPRWEWRAFSENFKQVEKFIQDKKAVECKSSDEIYIFSARIKDNIKIREGSIEVKKVIETKNSLEKWELHYKADFPLRAESLRELSDSYLKLEKVELEKESCSFSEFLELVKESGDLKTASVKKDRELYEIGSVRFEFSTVEIETKKLKTVCIEDEDSEKVENLVNQLDLKNFDNTSYLKAISLYFSNSL